MFYIGPCPTCLIRLGKVGKETRWSEKATRQELEKAPVVMRRFRCKRCGERTTVIYRAKPK